VEGDLDLLGTTRPVAFDLAAGDDGRLTGHAPLRQTDFGLKPYSALFGTLKVADEVEVAIDARLPAA
jgi:polyisoprenoid-binding protein YceI